MLNIRELRVVIASGTRSREITPETLAAALRLATVRPALLSLLLRPEDPQPVHRPEDPRGGGEVGGEVVPNERTNVGTNVTNVNVQENISPENVYERSLPNEQEPAPQDADARARRLADELDDRGSLGWYRQVVVTLDPLLVADALARALNLPAHRLRRSRAAYFTSIVAPFVRGEKSSHPYAQIPAPA